jgi:lysine 2,3-aminomutase
MAGLGMQGSFQERISPFLRNKMATLNRERGQDSPEYRALELQYVRSPLEDQPAGEANLRHWEADLKVEAQEHAVRGMERLYRNCLVIEPTMVCAAHCRYCLRANYEMFTLDEDELRGIAEYCGSPGVRNELSEVLVTGGDPLVVPRRLGYLIDALVEIAPNIKVIRIGSRLPQHDPDRIDDGVYEIFRRHHDAVRFELALQVNHPVELFPEVVEKLKQLQSLGVRMYAQNVLLKGVNDSTDTLVALYRRIRELGIETHYLFHSVPMRSTHHLRTSVARGLQLVQELTNSGLISGRAKPMYAAMTDIGKITLYEGVVLDRSQGRLLLQSRYRYDERKNWNPNWELPQTAALDEEGYMRVWYLDS